MVQMQSKTITRRKFFLGQNACTLIPFAIGMVDVSFLKKLGEGTVIKDQNTIKMRHKNLRIMGCKNCNYSFSINLN